VKISRPMRRCAGICERCCLARCVSSLLGGPDPEYWEIGVTAPLPIRLMSMASARCAGLPRLNLADFLRGLKLTGTHVVASTAFAVRAPCA